MRQAHDKKDLCSQFTSTFVQHSISGPGKCLSFKSGISSLKVSFRTISSKKIMGNRENIEIGPEKS